MCTVTVVPDRSGVRIVHSRDELRSRRKALPPRLLQAGAHAAILPLDPDSGGAWVAATDAGMALAVLNVNERPCACRTPRGRSRGLIIPALLDCSTINAALAKALAWPSDKFAPHRLVLIDEREIAQVVVRARGPQTVFRRSLTAPFLFTSSGLGDSLVKGPRRRLFRRHFAAPGARAAQQDAFHRLRWPRHPEIGVRMSRPDAETVSLTTIEISHIAVSLAYDDLAGPATCPTLFLPRQHRGHPWTPRSKPCAQ
jgi:Transport and Golgi organisation 2